MHLVVFPPRLLDKHYEQLLKCDERLFALSQLPFPDQESPLFDTTMLGPRQHSLNLNERRLGFESTFIRPSPNSTAPGIYRSQHYSVSKHNLQQRMYELLSPIFSSNVCL